ncbi:NepR family anti-sigma factor [Roseovarius sp. THAF9]|nr:NepR family anti-sigma factor [Roseovarius sp. THAF9]
MDTTIDENLKRAFDDVASEPLPSRFTDLLEQLKAEGAPKDSDPESDSNS